MWKALYFLGISTTFTPWTEEKHCARSFFLAKESIFRVKNMKEQAGTELGQAQLKLGLGFTSTIASN